MAVLSMRNLRRLGRALVLLCLMTLAPAPRAAADLKPGDVLNKDTAAQAEGLLPPEILQHYKDGKYENKIVEWPAGYRWDSGFMEATLDNKGKYELNDQGTIVDKSTKQQPPYIYGLPFPDIDPKDPQAGAKILWNAYYGYYNQGNSRNEVRLVWVNPDGIDRESGQDVYFMYYDGQSEAYRVPNPRNLLGQYIATTTFPTDLQGTTALSWRYRDPTMRDSDWAYVPSLRRVRAVSPTNRSDGFLGSDMSQDDGPFFDGKPEDFDWKLLESKDQLRLTDADGLAGKSRFKWLPAGGWRTLIDPNAQTVGFMKPGWTGLAWAPIGMALAKRPVWIIEATPKDKYYLYGKVQLYVDKETYQGVFNRKFNWRNELMNTYTISGFMSEKHVRPDGVEDWLWGATQIYQAAENVKMNRATVSGLPYSDKPESAVDRRISFDPSFFDFNTLQRFGK
jgi:hypothetical protein